MSVMVVDSLPPDFKSGDLIFGESSFQKATIKLLLDYEIASSWWASWIGNPWLQELAAQYFAWKVGRKYRRFRQVEAVARIVDSHQKGDGLR